MPRLVQCAPTSRNTPAPRSADEFTHIRRTAGAATLAAMAKAIKAAEAMAPTRPHPGVESATANIALGPVGALMDRTKDAVRKAMGSGSSRRKGRPQRRSPSPTADRRLLGAAKAAVLTRMNSLTRA